MDGNLTQEDAVECASMLPRHLTFTASFDADAGDAQQAMRCYYPCSKTSQQWHTKLAGQKVERVVDKMEFECKRAVMGLLVCWIIFVAKQTLCIVEFLHTWTSFTRTTKRCDHSIFL
jgi:hypothetical protein